MKTEKYAVFGILTLVLLIASFNMVGALSLLVLEKRKDMSILMTMGATNGMIQKIFVTEGLLWSLTGGFTGIILATVICLAQQKFQLIKLDGNFIIQAYPVVMQWQDFLVVIGTVALVGILAAWYPARKAMNAPPPSLKN